MSAAPRTLMAYAAYLAAERSAPVKHEYLRGQVWAKAGGTVEHGRLAVSVSTALSNALRGKPCAVLSSDVRVRIESSDRATYPDVTVVCGAHATASDDAELLFKDA